MSQEIIMPKLGLTMTHGKITRWLKKEGDLILKGEPIAEIETDKITSELESEVEGYLLKILAEEGEEREITAPICLVGEKNASQPNVARIFITPLAKRIAIENGIDYTDIKGSGPEGRILKIDILNAINQNKNAKTDQLYATETAKDSKEAEVKIKTVDTYGNGQNVLRRVSLTPIRKVIAKRLSQSKQDIPHVYFKSTIDATNLIELKNKMADLVMKKTGEKLSLNDLIMKAVALALREFEDINTSLVDDEIIYHNDINIGMAVSIDGGLVVPVIKNADKISLSEINTLSHDLVSKARCGKLGLADMEGGTFTVSNLGAYDIDEFSAIINPPESAILAVGKAKETPCVENGQIIAKTTMVLTLSVDHRIIDGALAAQFMKRLKALMEDAYSILI